MQQVDAATRVQSVVRRRLDKHKIDDLIQQKRVDRPGSRPGHSLVTSWWAQLLVMSTGTGPKVPIASC